MKIITAESFRRMDRIVSLIEEGRSDVYISAACGITVEKAARYRVWKKRSRVHHARRRLIREAYAEGRSIRWLAKDFRMDWRDVEALVSDIRPAPLKPQPQPREPIALTLPSQVIVEDVAPDGTAHAVLVQPTGRYEFCFGGRHPERQWMFEAIDSRDTYPKLYAMTDVRQLIGEPEQARPPTGLADETFAMAG